MLPVANMILVKGVFTGASRGWISRTTINQQVCCHHGSVIVFPGSGPSSAIYSPSDLNRLLYQMVSWEVVTAGHSQDVERAGISRVK